MEKVNIFALGGQDENGKNCFVLDYNDNLYVVNTGVKIPINSNNGVDTLIPDFTFLEKNKKKIQGIFISDIRNESFSALPWLVMKVPGVKIYTSFLNKQIIQERLSKYNIKPNSYEIISLSERIKLGEIYIQPIALPGCAPGNLGFDFITPNGDYVFMFNYVEGDLGIFGRTWFLHLPKLFNKRKINALITDAGNSRYTGRAIEKLFLPNSVEKMFQRTSQQNKIIIGGYSEDMVSMQQIIELAVKYNRPIIPYGKAYADLLFLVNQIQEKLDTKFKFPEILDYKQVHKVHNAVVLVTGAINRLYTRFIRIVNNEDVYLKITKEDAVIVIAPSVNGLESLAAITLDEIAKITPNLIDISDNEYFYCRPTREDVYNLTKYLKPTILLPVQGLYRYLVDLANYIKEDKILAKEVNPVILQNGKIAHFANGKLVSQNGKIKDVGDVIIDGFGVGDISSEVLAEREILGREGVIIINSMYSPKTKQIIGKLNINYVGVIDPQDQPYIDALIKEIIADVMLTKTFLTMREFNEKVRKTIRKRIFKITDKDPMVAFTLTTI
ncbi:ribonuclease J [Mycoplasmopsis mustelae]|uniref:Ribonuclease J n=1 Tax=Mycoplasmopsis mustelae TaxID=171289 RepID=A0A4R7UEG0_9BACT|nr:ribonuclease J [Mycoplasmopsis mustelae]TDV24253.1 ribonuclease J [Mycoplasmopsis mustelae]